MNNEVIEEIKSRLPVEDVVGQYVELKRAGRTLKGRSPWGVDKTPSFMVSPEKGIWHDFSAGKGGDIFKFIMEVEGITFREALEKLAAQAGVNLQRYHGDDKEIVRRKTRAKEALELSAKFYQWNLTKNKKVQEYAFYKRNLNRKTIEEFRIGYAPMGGKVLTELLLKRGYTKEEMGDGGLLNRFDGDMFRGRLTIPFIDTNGSVIGYTARILTKGEPKYLNTPDTILFNKSRFIFGLYQAKEAIRREGYVVIVEGNMDVISSHQAGVKTAVATSGTAMTEMHLKILSRLTPDVRLAYDGDEAGVRATERVIKMAQELGVKLTVIYDYHGAKDPDELIQKDPELWKKAVNEAKPAVEYVIEKYEEKADLMTAEGKQEFAEKTCEVVKDLPAVMQKHYLKMIAKRLDVEVEDLNNYIEKKDEGVFRKRMKNVKTQVNVEKNSAMKRLEESMLALLIYGGVNANIELEIPEDETRLSELEMIFSEKYGEWNGELLQGEIDGLISRYEKEKNRMEIEELKMKLDEADEIEAKVLLEKIMTLQKNS